MTRHKKRIDEKIKAGREKGKLPKLPMSILLNYKDIPQNELKLKRNEETI